MRNRLVWLAFAGMMASSFLFAHRACAEPEDMPDWGADTLTGDWSGARSSLYNKGIDVEFTHKSDVMANASGGIKRGATLMGHTEARIKMDLEKLWGLNTTTAYFHYHSQLGSKFNSSHVGSFVGVDNIEASTNTAQFAHAWLQKSFSADSLSVLAGLYSIDSEFYVTDTTGVFIEPPYGMANDLAQSGQNGPPIFPIGALAVRAKYTTPSKNVYLQGTLTDGVPGDPNNPHGTHIQLNKGEGTLSVVEFGYTPQQSEPPFELAKPGEMIEPEQKVHEKHQSFNKTALGFWHYSAKFNDPDPVNPALHSSQGVYFLAERTLAVEKNHPAQGLAGFVRFGTASKDIHQADWTGSLGLRYHGLIANRDEDIAGIAVTVSHASEKYRLLSNAESAQTAVEATYRAQVYPWLALQPTLQYIANPNMDKALGNAWVVGARFELAL
jgi:porin